MTSIELNVFTEHYPKLCDTLTDIEDLLPHFIKENVIKFGDREEISATVTSTKKVEKLMIHISGPLRAGSTDVFNIMLRIMGEYGHRATQQLAHQIRTAIVSHSRRSTDQYVQIGATNGNETPADQQCINLRKKLFLAAAVILLLSTLLVIVTIGFSGIQHQITLHSLYDSNTLPKDILLLNYYQGSVDNKFQSIDTWSQQLVVSTKDQLQVTPVILNIKNKIKDDTFIQSYPFFTFEEGHLMSMGVYLNGYGDGEGTHLSVVLLLMKGPHDDKLEQSGHWPLRGTFTIELLNQLNDSDHYNRKIQFHHQLCSECTNRVLEGVTAHTGFVDSLFISHDILLNKSNNAYNKHDYFFFRISFESIEPSYQVAPITFKLTYLSQWQKNKQTWCSSPFFAFNGGYQMILTVDIAGCNSTHVSVFLHLMKGPHDDKLEQSGYWPLRGTFTIELLNQLNDSDHYSYMMQFHHYLCGECTKRVLEEANASEHGHGHPWLVSHDTLFQNSSAYNINDSLTIRISYEDIESPFQIAPVTFKLAHFSQWLKNKQQWFSSPFFAFSEGYQIFLRVGYRSKDHLDHVLVCLHLMKGPYDDKLEQSGHWPLRGIFTIELLNQLNDSDHYSDIVQFPLFIPSNYTNRVLAGFVANGGVCQFIPHDVLFHNSNNISYNKDDCLLFRISYEDTELPYQVAPVTFKLTHFFYWLNKKKWYSSPFFAFSEGYQMLLRVDTTEDKDHYYHISVYLYLMKGPHDDKLEQSGHWPLRGTFTIELLDQSYDRSYYKAVYFLSSATCFECTKRVMHEGDLAMGYGGQFISINNLDYYYSNETLYFRVTYSSCHSCVYINNEILPMLMSSTAVIVMHTLIIFGITVQFEIFGNHLGTSKPIIVVDDLAYHCWIIMPIMLKDIFQNLLILWIMLAAEVLNVLMWEFTSIVSYQSYIIIHNMIFRGFHVFFYLKAIYVHTMLHVNETLIFLSPILLFVVPLSGSYTVIIVISFVFGLFNCFFNFNTVAS